MTEVLVSTTKMATWTEEREEELIALWRARPCLYDSSSRGYTNRITKRDALMSMASALDTSVLEITRRIHSFRTQYARLWKVQLRGNAVKRRTGRQQWFIKHLAFLSCHLKKPRVSNFDIQIEESGDVHQILNDTESVKAAMESMKAETESMKADSDVSMGIVSEEAEIEATREKRDSGKREAQEEIALEFLKSVKKTLEMDKKDDELEIFCKNIVFKLRKIQDPWTLVVVQNEIEQACFRGIMASQPNQPVTDTANNNHEAFSHTLNL